MPMTHPGLGTPRIPSRSTPGDLVGRIDAELSSLRGFRWRTTGHQIMVTSWETPGWAAAVAFLAFPIGLLAVLARRTVVGFVVCRATEDGSEVTCIGNLPGPVVDLVRTLAAG